MRQANKRVKWILEFRWAVAQYKRIRISTVEDILNGLRAAMPSWTELIRVSLLSEGMIRNYQNLLRSRREMLDI